MIVSRFSSIGKLWLMLFFLMAQCCASAGAWAAEEILAYDVIARFDPQGRMRVMEKITVRAEGDRIKRGIFRKLPLVWQRSDNKQFAVQYVVKDILVDDSRELYQVTSENQELTIRVGNPHAMLSHGVHTFVLLYDVQNHFSRFDQWDELYWNITGNQWQLPIKKVRFTLEFWENLDEPSDQIPVTFTSVDIYTGSIGEKGNQAKRVGNDTVVTTAPLLLGEGVTVAYTWPRAVLANAPDPIESNLLLNLFVPDMRSLPLLLAPLVLLFYCAVFCVRHRPRIAPPSIIPLFDPPKGCMPGELRYADAGSYDQDAFGADLLHLVTRGAMRFVKATHGTSMRKLERVDSFLTLGKHAPKEAEVLGILFSDRYPTFDVTKPDQQRMKQARRYLRSESQKMGKTIFISRASIVWMSILCVCALPLAAAFCYDEMLAIPFSAIFLFLCTFFFGLVWAVAYQFKKVTTFIGVLWLIPKVLFFVPFFIALAVFAYGLFTEIFIDLTLPRGFIGVLLFTLCTAIVGFVVAPRRTAHGLQQHALIQGLRLYLGTAEEKRFEALYPPQDSVERFERLLPFALALGVGETWANRFASYLTEHNATSSSGLHNWGAVESFSSRSHAASTAASSGSHSSSSSSSSGSGSSGGGSSGGGSGGGGGGGW